MNSYITRHATTFVNVSAILALFIIGVHIIFLVLIFGVDLNYFYGLDYQFHLDGEYNISAIFSSLMLALSAYLLTLIYFKTEQSKRNKYWLVLAFLFSFLAADELLSFHEQLILPLRSYFELTGYLYFSWVLAGMLLVLIVLLSSLSFLRSLPRYFFKRFLIAGLIYLTGVIGMEMIGAKEAYDSGYIYGWVATKERGVTYAIIVTIEETLEICGILYFNSLLAQYLKKYSPEKGDKTND